MHVIPPNGFPNVPSFADLDRIAKQIENMPTFTSDDRAFLSDLPSYPSEDGTKVLTATTKSGETSLSYEEVESGMLDYSTEEQATGQKWIDGKEIYRKTFASVGSFTSPISIAHGISNIDTIVNKNGTLYYGSTYHAISIDHAETGNSVAHSIINSDNIVLNYGSDYSGVNAISKYDVTLYYTKTTQEEEE